ncbi:hypothetical protein [Streptomyces sp. N35]|uniref:hypothetical protein n=1 Tax=Streptomyces sp. N35 TaxID=2795730 RepID=UPI0018F75B0D|nr:hypothetical protein [Streptomyces sp. N35]
MTFDARRVAGEQASKPFEFTGMDGATYELPNINTVTGAQAKRMKAGDDSVFEEIASPRVVRAMDEMPVGVQESLVRAWIAHGGASGKGVLPSSRRPPRRKPSRST